MSLKLEMYYKDVHVSNRLMVAYVHLRMEGWFLASHVEKVFTVYALSERNSNNSA